MKILLRSASVVAVAVAAAPTYAHHSVAQMNLEAMVTQADLVFIGRVIDMTESVVDAGGGQLPATTFTLAVSESFKGQYEEIKGQTVARVTMLGTRKQFLTNTHPIREFPNLTMDKEYLLAVAPAGKVGLTTTMGWGQGCFLISGKGSTRFALNGVNNVGLFSDMETALPSDPSVSLDQLKAMIRAILGGQE